MVFLNTFVNSVNEVMSTNSNRKRVVVVESSYGHRTFLVNNMDPSFYVTLLTPLKKKKCLYLSPDYLYFYRKKMSVLGIILEAVFCEILFLRQSLKPIHLYNQGEG